MRDLAKSAFFAAGFVLMALTVMWNWILESLLRFYLSPVPSTAFNLAVHDLSEWMLQSTGRILLGRTALFSMSLVCFFVASLLGSRLEQES